MDPTLWLIICLIFPGSLVFILMVIHVESRGAIFRIVPNRLQFFELESVFFHCEGLDGSAQLKGIRNTEEFISVCDKKSPTLLCAIHRVYSTDSGEYWCETGAGEKSKSINITITPGSVILESPVVPVMEGNNVTLRCRNKTKTSNLTAHFYKDGFFIGTSYTDEMTIRKVSMFDEGLYKCKIVDTGESPESLLTVRDLHGETCSSCCPAIYVFLTLRTTFTVLMVAVFLLVVGLFHCGKLGVRQK
ncbi:Fc receptor-like protein 5 [Archocentrus centrarchus]|uniref:Fc receptor-like protein 5 n=1 Tax=Archocentrus centrarchus TaxID=63155 RepID=UPI0011E9BA01|nr:Fc receptor-like protein 5 [Archocentrus centrarchus]